ncbi:hypothetical protein LTS18_002056 [Coniosporium uncinatum]|uniref:Uncharacterized protein n=1 Tax=Coniosporium uncinatum TaxID=93489 RepID=A0ACC3DUK0_9PEZI|nr:hypothetical protein LTS18_002056 [Coniosporium uncinatum]
MCHKVTYTYTLCSHPDTSSRNRSSLRPIRDAHAGLEHSVKPLVHIHHCDTAMQSSSPAKRCEDLDCETLALGLEGWCPRCRLSHVSAGYEVRKGAKSCGDVGLMKHEEKGDGEGDGWVVVDRKDGMRWDEEESPGEEKGRDGIEEDSSSEGSLPSAPPSSHREESDSDDDDVGVAWIGAWADCVGESDEWVAQRDASLEKAERECAGRLCVNVM